MVRVRWEASTRDRIIEKLTQVIYGQECFIEEVRHRITNGDKEGLEGFIFKSVVKNGNTLLSHQLTQLLNV